MFGFSLTKLLVLALIVGGVLMVFKMISRKNEAVPRRSDEPRAFDTEYDADSGTYIVRDKQPRDK